MKERIAVTGVGVVTPIGVGFDSFSTALRAGRSGVRAITAFDATGLPVQIAAEVDDASFDAPAHVRPLKALKLMSRAALFAVVAAGLARRHAGLAAGSVDPERLGVSLGAGGMGIADNDLLAGQALAAIEARGSDPTRWDVPGFARVYLARTNPLAMIRGLPNIAAAHVAIQNDARGPSLTVTTACSAGTQAIGDALRVLQRGDADAMLCGGSDAMINPVGVLGFTMLGTLSRRNEAPTRASRPFERARDGFVIGEGAAVLVLERESFARARGARPLGELAGYAATCDAYRITDERPDAAGAEAAIRLTLADAGATPSDVGYVNAHGTGTPLNDRMETLAIKAALGKEARRVPVSSTKSMIGHLLAAAGAVEAAATLAGLAGGFLPPTINHDEPDPACDLDYVPNKAREQRFDAALSNSFGFGGQNACLLIRRW